MSGGKKDKYPRPKVIFIDVDGTLVVKGKVNLPVVNWMKKQYAKGFEIIVWSSRGKEYVDRIVKEAEISHLVATISKPGYIVDDMRLSWLGYVAVIHPSQIREKFHYK